LAGGPSYGTILILPALAAWVQFIVPKVLTRYTSHVSMTRHRPDIGLSAILAKAGLSDVDVLVIGSGDTSLDLGQCNAAAIGIGKGRKIVVLDSLIANLAPEEVSAIIAHEVAHLSASHPRRTITMLAAYSVGCTAAAVSLESVGDWKVWSLAIGLALLVGPTLLRADARRMEFEADAIASRFVPGADLAKAIEKVDALNAVRRGSWFTRIMSTHPDTASRRLRLSQQRVAHLN